MPDATVIPNWRQYGEPWRGQPSVLWKVVFEVPVSGETTQSALEYAGYGEVSDFAPGHEQAHQLFGVFNYSGALEVEAGIGFGLTDASDGVTFKLILSTDLNKPRSK